MKGPAQARPGSACSVVHSPVGCKQAGGTLLGAGRGGGAAVQGGRTLVPLVPCIQKFFKVFRTSLSLQVPLWGCFSPSVICELQVAQFKNKGWVTEAPGSHVGPE